MSCGVPRTNVNHVLTFVLTAPPKAKGQKMALGDFLQDTCEQDWVCGDLQS
jgi:hypothetical protein